jgi:hypothetical protein
MAEITRRRQGELLAGVFEVLQKHPDGLAAKDVLRQVSKDVLRQVSKDVLRQVSKCPVQFKVTTASALACSSPSGPGHSGPSTVQLYVANSSLGSAGPRRSGWSSSASAVPSPSAGSEVRPVGSRIPVPGWWWLATGEVRSRGMAGA